MKDPGESAKAAPKGNAKALRQKGSGPDETP